MASVKRCSLFTLLDFNLYYIVGMISWTWSVRAKVTFCFNYYVWEIHETKVPLVCNPLTEGQIIPEMLETFVYGRYQATCFHSPKQIWPIYTKYSLSFVGGRFIGRKLLGCKLALDWMYACPWLDLMENTILLQTVTWGHIQRTWVSIWPEPIHLVSI